MARAARGVDVPPGCEGRGDLAVDAVEQGPDLLALRLAHRLALDALGGRLVAAPRGHLGDDACLVERAAQVTGRGEEPHGVQTRLRSQQHAVCRRRHVSLARPAAQGQMHDRDLLRRAKAGQ